MREKGKMILLHFIHEYKTARIKYERRHDFLQISGPNLAIKKLSINKNLHVILSERIRHVQLRENQGRRLVQDSRRNLGLGCRVLEPPKAVLKTLYFLSKKIKAVSFLTYQQHKKL